MQVEIIEKKDLKERIPIKIEAPPKYKMELRAIVWSTRECVYKDEKE